MPCLDIIAPARALTSELADPDSRPIRQLRHGSDDLEPSTRTHVLLSIVSFIVLAPKSDAGSLGSPGSLSHD